MRTAIRFAKAAGALLALGIAFLVLVATLGAAKTQYSCSGELIRNASDDRKDRTAATLYARVETYRWFVFWADHDAMIFWEIQPSNYVGFGYYSESPLATPIWDFERSQSYGSWSSLSRKISVETASNGTEVFSGTCQ